MPGSRRRERVLLVSMPFGPAERPSLALGLLQAHCQAMGVECDTRYLALAFAEMIGARDYLWLTNDVPYTAFAGDWVFAEALYGPRAKADDAYLAEVLGARWRIGDTDVARVRRIRAAVPEFLDRCLEGEDWDERTLVGFTSVFQQNLASLALAARLKGRHPHLTVAFGGANWEEPMGSALRRQFPFVDLSFSGEADRSWPELLSRRRRGQAAGDVPGVAAGDVPGVAAGDPSAACPTGPPDLVEDLDDIPVPDFDPFFDQLRSRPALSGVQPVLLLETARGCWWGERSQCTFCGLNGSSMGFRSKSPERAFVDIVALHHRYRVGTISVVDNILDMRYLRTVLPRLAEARLGVDLFWEVKANLTYRQVAQLRAAGVMFIQPGIESLSDHVLQLMRKGTTAARNVELLKWCAEYGVTPLWNLLYGFPGETAEDYRQTADIIPAIWHLTPPSGYGPIRLDRFSPYQADPESFGMVNVRPMAPLPDLYPFDADAVSGIAYYFDFDYADGGDADRFAGEAVALARAWMSDRRRGALWMRSLGHGLHLVDSRRSVAPSARRAVISGWKAAVYLACDRAQELSALQALPEVERADVGPGEVVAFLERALALRLVLHLDGRWLNLAVHTPARPALRSLDVRAEAPAEVGVPVSATGAAAYS